jgi:L-lactate dehydrogenase complex protein LldE
MNVGLFVPCYVDQFYPHVAKATLELLERIGVTVDVPLRQTCCGQPMANSGFENLTGRCGDLFIKNFHPFDYIVSPSGSCVLHVKEHLRKENQNETLRDDVQHKIYELTEFLTDVLKITDLGSVFPYQVGFHQSCHAQRGLHLAQMTELVAPPFSKPMHLLNHVKEIKMVELSRNDECCGFGGTFCVSEDAVSVKMGKDRISDHLVHGAEYITGTDMSCLMHLDGLLKRMKSNTRVIHIAEILNTIN